MNRDIAIATLCLHGFIPSWSGPQYVVWHPDRLLGYWIERRPQPTVMLRHLALPEEQYWDDFDTDDLVQLAQSKRVLHGGHV